MNDQQADAWKSPALVQKYLTGVRGAIPMAAQQIDVMMRLIESIFNDYFVDSLHAMHIRGGSHRSREQIAQEYYNRPDKAANILALVELQCGWLRSIGFEDVDCYFKVFELAVFGGRRPKSRN